MAWSWQPLAPFAALLIAAEGFAAPPLPLTVPVGTEVVLPPGSELRARFIAEGITVGGRLVARGTAQRPIVFTGPSGWRGIQVTGEAVLEHVLIEGAEEGLKVSGGTVSLADSVVTACATGLALDQAGRGDVRSTVFRGNGTALAAGLRARVEVTDCLVTGSREVGFLVSRQGEATIARSSFLDNAIAVRLWQKTNSTLTESLVSGNPRGVVADQTEGGPSLTGNVFTGNGTAVEVVNGSSVRLERNLFSGNRTAVEANQISSPAIAGNTFADNRTGVAFLKRSRGTVTRNIFDGNHRSVFCDFSSYPVVSANNFEGQGTAVALGENQSFDWESREGRRATPVPGQPTPPPPMPSLDAQGNWWGAATTVEMAASGADGDVGAIDDGHDHAPVSYDGYAGRNYRRDLVTFRPWLREPVRDAGAPRDYLRELTFPGAKNPLSGR